MNKFNELADLPSREELLAMFISDLNQPMSKLVGTLSGVLSKLVIVLNGLKEDKS